MHLQCRFWLALIALLALSTQAVAAGRIAGRVVDQAGDGIGGVKVVLGETTGVTVSGRDGTFFFERVPEGTHLLKLSLGEEVHVVTGIEVETREIAHVEVIVDWQPGFADEITVAASRQVERTVDAPASVVALSGEALARRSGVGEIPQLLASSPGVNTTNAAGFFSKISSRGFNGYSMRGLQVFVDGVDQSNPFTGSQGYIPRNLMDLASVELVKGPTSSLYGANAVSGVLDLITKRPSDSRGGTVRLTLGDPDFLRADLRWAGKLDGDWFFKVVGSYQEGDYFTRSRNLSTEYPGLPLEALPVPDGKVKAGTYALRLDKQFQSGSLLSLERGLQKVSGNAVTVSGGNRFTVGEPLEQPWTRLAFTGRYIDARAYTFDRKFPDFVSLANGAHLFDDSQRRYVEIVGRNEFGRLRLVGGGSYREEDIGISVLREAVDAHSTAVFAQADFRVGRDLRLVAAARWDEGTLYDGRISPKVGLVWGIDRNHTLHAASSEAFLAPTYVASFLDTPFFLPTLEGPLSAVDLSSIESSLCAPVGIVCGFAMPTPVRLVGNQDLEVEEVKAVEAGYSGILGEDALLSVDYYRSRFRDFFTTPLPDPFGTSNSRFIPYRPPSGHPSPDLVLAALEQTLGSFFPFLLLDADGAPVFVPLAFTNAGRVDTQGLDLAVNLTAGADWLLDVTYSWFDFDVVDEGIGGGLFPNTPEHKAGVGATYLGSRFDVSVRYRWVDGFFWSSGSWVGPVPSYSVVGLSGNYAINERWAVGANVINLFDDEHYQAFGGDLLGRRTLVHATIEW